MRCDGSVISKTECPNEAVWAVCCSSDACVFQSFVCTVHEVEARAEVERLVSTSGVCPFCGLKYNSVEHAISQWFPLEKE